jgi:pSer/pThr/pTyr-binding forkhead associated (FHA) protein
MHDGQTKKVRGAIPTPSLEGFLGKHRAVIVTLSGTTAGNEYELDQARMSIGRGPGVALEFNDSTMSREHAAFEVIDDSFRVRDLGSTNGILVNGAPVLTATLKHGDRIELGEHKFQFLLEKRKRDPKAYQLSES